jgi:Flp pilus assembly protein TadD
MRCGRLVSIVTIVAVAGLGAACTERSGVTGPSSTTGTTAGRKLGSDKPIRVTGHVPADRSGVPPAPAVPPPAAAPGKQVDRETVIRLGDDATRRGNYTIAAAFYDEAARRAPQDAALRKKLGFALFRARRFGLAQDAFERALALSANDPEALRGLGNTRIAQGHPHKAIAIFRRALAASRGRADHRIYNGLGVALDLTGDHRAAQRAYRRGLARAPGDDSLRNNYALSLAASGHYAQAARLIEALIRARPANAKFRRNLERVRAMAAKAGVKLRKHRPRADLRPRPPTVATAHPRDRRPVGPPRTLVPGALSDIKALARHRVRKDDAADADKRSADKRDAARPSAATAPAPAGVTDASDRELLPLLRPGTSRAPRRNRPARPARPGDRAAALNRLAPVSAPADRHDDTAERADRLFRHAPDGGDRRRRRSKP